MNLIAKLGEERKYSHAGISNTVGLPHHMMRSSPTTTAQDTVLAHHSDGGFTVQEFLPAL